MKKTLTVITALMLMAAPGCEKIKDISANNVQEDSSSMSEAASEPEKSEEKTDKSKVTNKTSYKKVYITDPNKKDKLKESSDSSSNEDSDSKGDNNDVQDGGSANIGGYSADEIYQNAVEMYGSVVMGCPYMLDYDDMDSNGFAAIADSDVSGTDDIVSRYCSVFSEPDSYIYEKYVEKDGKVYCSDASRGSNIYYIGTDLEYVSGDESNMTFNAVSHYRDPDTGEAMEDRTAVFSVKMTDDGYKVTEFKYPV